MPGLPYLKAEAVYAARHEMARSVDDVLTRRTRARLLARDATAAAAAEVAALLAPELGLGRRRTGRAGRPAIGESSTNERAAAQLPETALEAAIGQ